MSTIKNAHRTAIFSRLIGQNIARLRDIIAASLIKLGVKPNTLTLLGLIVTAWGAFFLALGSGDRVGGRTLPYHSWYGFWAAIILIIASACDILDGAVARKSQQITRLGGFLDSCFDRIADGLIFIGVAIYYVRRPELPHSQLFAVLSITALVNAQIISYVKARAENYIDNCGVGYWQRGERIAAILIGLFSGHIATVIAMLAVLPAFTVLRRLLFAYRQIKRLESKQPPLDPYPPLQGIMRLALWRCRRGTWQYDLITAANIAAILLIDLQNLF